MSLVVVIFDGKVKGFNGYPVVALLSNGIGNEGNEFRNYFSDVDTVIGDEAKH